jgi:hypothetical protein
MALMGKMENAECRMQNPATEHAVYYSDKAVSISDQESR